MSDFLMMWMRPEGVIALGVVVNIVQQWRSAHRITTLEINTNSIKDALVASTAKASDLEGEKRGLAIAAEAQARKDGT